ncbi:MAG: hypothetical protein IJM37_02240 [Lachnospiraceae bacterium]|nr:hypothetical protein [Lachnospiraceae bacterium]
MKKDRYVREIDRKKISAASVVGILIFITGAAFFGAGMLLTIKPELGDASIAASLGWIALLLFIFAVLILIMNYKINKRIWLSDKIAIALNSLMIIGMVALYIWGLVS